MTKTSPHTVRPRRILPRIAAGLSAILTIPLLGLAGISGTAHAAHPGENGRIAFSSTRDGNLEIYTMNADGSDVVRLTSNTVPDAGPAWSPDGTRIAFASEIDAPAGLNDAKRAPYSEIYIMNADGTGLTRVTNNQQEDNSPSWSPDGQHLVYDGITPDGKHHHIYRIDVDGTNLQDLTPDGNDLPGDACWSPDGNSILYDLWRNSDQHIELWLMNADGSNQRRITPDDNDSMHGDWSPDGQRIVFSSTRDDESNDLYIMNADGGNVVRLTDTDNVAETNPHFSADGSRIAYVRNWNGDYVNPKDTSGKTLEIDVMNADGTGDVRLTDNKVMDTAPDWQPIVNRPPSAPGAPSLSAGTSPSGSGILSLAWSASNDPDGDPLTYTLQERNGAVGAAWQTIQSGLTAPAYTFGASNPETDGTWIFRVQATDSRTATSGYGASSVPVVVDTTAPSRPTLAAAAGQTPVSVNGTDWYRDTVTLNVTPGVDPVLADGTPGSGVDPSSYSASLVVSASGISTLTKTNADRAGNVSDPSMSFVAHVDAAAPHLAISCPSTVTLGGTASATVTASDGESGLAADPSGQVAIPTGTVGPQTVTATATDNVGHSTQASCNTAVIYHFGGLDLAVNGQKDAKAGRTIPVSFGLTDAANHPVSTARATLDVAPVDDDGSVGTYAPAVAPGKSYTGNLFAWDNQGKVYTYNWSTKPLSAGTYSLRITLDDGTTHTALIMLQ